MMGELGNQLFQLAFALSKSRLQHQHLELVFTSNPNRLLEFNLPTISFSEPNRFGVLILRIRFKIVKMLIKTLALVKFNISIKLIERITNTVTEKIPHKFDDSLLSENNTALHYGYFQSWKYFVPIENEIRKVLKVKNASPEFKELRDTLSLAPFTAIHIRRGGFGPSIINSEFHGFASVNYYLRAIVLLKELGDDFPVVIFTDNVEKANEIISALPVKAKIVIGPSDIKSQSETLELMSSCDAFIGANSSYSWWAAYLGDKKGKNTIFPRPWYKNDGISEQDLLAPNWITLGLEANIQTESN